MPTLNTTLRLNAAEDPIARDRSGSAAAMAELFGPLDRLLSGGGDARLAINPASGVNGYGCLPFPCLETLSFASSTATSISGRAYDVANDARQSLMQSAIAVGIDAAFDARIEAMRDELKACLGLSETRVEVVFSPSGTDSQLQALLLAGALLGPVLTTIIVAADQTGSGTADTARGQHFSAATAHGYRVQKGEPIAGLMHSVTSVALPSFDETGGFRPHADSDAGFSARLKSRLQTEAMFCFKSWIRRSWAGGCQATNVSTKSRRAGPIGSRSSSTPVKCASAGRGCRTISTADIS